MPHIKVQMWPGKSNEQKQALDDAMSQCIQDVLGSSEASVSVAIEDIQPNDWGSVVYEPEIEGKPELLFKQPGYSKPV